MSSACDSEYVPRDNALCGRTKLWLFFSCRFALIAGVASCRLDRETLTTLSVGCFASVFFSAGSTARHSQR